MSPDEQEAYYDEIRRSLEHADEVSADTAVWLAERRYGERQYEEPARAAPQQPETVFPVPRAPARDWPAEEKWIDRRVAAYLDPIAREIGGVCGTLERRIAELEDGLTKSDAAVVELLLELERRVAALETRAAPQPGPLRLIGGPNADAA